MALPIDVLPKAQGHHLGAEGGILAPRSSAIPPTWGSTPTSQLYSSCSIRGENEEFGGSLNLNLFHY